MQKFFFAETPGRYLFCPRNRVKNSYVFPPRQSHSLLRFRNSWLFTASLPAPGRQRQANLCVQGQSGTCSHVQASQGDIGRPCLIQTQTLSHQPIKPATSTQEFFRNLEVRTLTDGSDSYFWVAPPTLLQGKGRTGHAAPIKWSY